MSFIRPGSNPRWVDQADTEGLYVYGDGERLCYMPNTEAEFVEVTMRMLEQSDVLSEDELNDVYTAFATRLNWADAKETANARNRVASDATEGLLEALCWFDDNGYDELADGTEEIWEEAMDIKDEVRFGESATQEDK